MSGCVNVLTVCVYIAGENVPEEEQQLRDQRSAEPYDNTPVIDNLPPAGGGVSVSGEERSKYQEDITNLYKQLDDKVRLRKRQTFLFHTFLPIPSLFHSFLNCIRTTFPIF